MPEPSSESEPIPPDLQDTFHVALRHLGDWTLGGPEPEVSFRLRPCLISAICELVTSFNDPVPEDIQYLLLRMRIELPPELPGFTYAAAGRGCLKEIGARKASYERTQKL